MASGGTVEIVNGEARATIARRGAEALAWRAGGAEMLWSPDARHWDATAPILFPVCGWTRGGVARVGGQTYPLGLHGFARFEDFEVATRGEDYVRMVLRDNEATRARFPFSFELSIRYRVAASRLDVLARVTNTGAAIMPYALGLHPGFRWPLFEGDKRDYSIRFDAPQRRDVPVIATGGLFSTRRRPVAFAEDGSLPLSDATFANEALCFLDRVGAALEYRGPGGKGLRVATSNFPHTVLWSRPGAPFLCVESWSGHGDPEDFVGELADKPSMRLLAPGESGRHHARYELLDAAGQSVES